MHKQTEPMKKMHEVPKQMLRCKKRIIMMIMEVKVYEDVMSVDIFFTL